MDSARERALAWRQLRQEKNAATAAAAILSERHDDPSEVMKVTGLLGHRDPAVRINAINSLSDTGGRQAVPAITNMVHDTNVKVRIAACRALGHLRAHSSKAVLYDSLHDKDKDVCAAAALALAQMGDRQGMDQIVVLLGQKGTHQKDTLKALNYLTRQNFPLTSQGIRSANMWLRTRREPIS